MLKYLLLFVLVGHTMAFAISDKALGVTIDLAGKQRMLTQRMAKESLLILMNQSAKANRQKLQNDLALFDKTLKGLIAGDKDLGLVPVTDAAIQAQLAKVSELFAPFEAAATAIIEGNATDADYNQVVLEKNMILLQEMNKAVYMYAALTDQAQNRSLKMGTNINLAGKQRMLTQRMAKDLLIAAMASPKERRPYTEDFAQCQRLFDRTINGLIAGDKALHLVETTLPDIHDQLEKVRALWRLKQRTFERAIDDPAKLRHAVESLDTLMTEMNTAVKLYTRSIVRQKLRRKLSSIVNAYVGAKTTLRTLVNLSGKQRMLTQRMAKLSLQCALGLERTQSCAGMLKYQDEYARALTLFVQGDTAQNIPPTRDKKALLQIKKILTAWQPFAQAIHKLAAAQGHDKAALLYILQHEQPLLHASDTLVKLYEHSDPSSDPLQKARLRIVNVAGRQRMLTQKMTKEKLLWYQLKSAKQKAKMLQTLAQFEEALGALIHGDPQMGLPRVTNPKIKAQLQKVSEIWHKIKPLYTQEALSPKELSALLRVNPILLKQMHQAVGMMERAVEY